MEIELLRFKSIETVLHGLSLQGYQYGIIHGLDPRVGRDVDVLVNQKDLHLIAELTSDLLSDDGWRVSKLYLPTGAYLIIGSKEINGFTVGIEIDYMYSLVWKGVPLIHNLSPELINNQYGNDLKYDAWGSFVKRVLLQCCAQEWDKLANCMSELVVREHEASVVASKLGQLLGIYISELFLKALQSKRLDKIIECTDVVRAKLRKQAWMLCGGKGIWSQAGGRWLIGKLLDRIYFKQRAPIVSIYIEGFCDGGGAILHHLCDNLKKYLVFPKVTLFEKGASHKKVLSDAYFGSLAILNSWEGCWEKANIVRCTIKKERQGCRIIFVNSTKVEQYVVLETLPMIFSRLLMNEFHELNR